MVQQLLAGKGKGQCLNILTAFTAAGPRSEIPRGRYTARTAAPSVRASISARPHEKKREELQRAATPLDAPMIRCEACGGLTPGGRNRKYCPACAKKRAKERMEAANAGRYRYTPNKKPQAEEKHYTRPRRTGLLFDLSGKDLAEVALEAKTLGMSYGEYTSACFGGTIEKKLIMQGISREEAGKMIANAKRKKARAKKKKAS